MAKTEFGEIHLSHKQTVDLIQGLADRTINLAKKYPSLCSIYQNQELFTGDYYFNVYVYTSDNGPVIGYITMCDNINGWRAWVHPTSNTINKNHIEFTLTYPDDGYDHTPFNMVNVVDDFHKILDKVELRMNNGNIK